MSRPRPLQPERNNGDRGELGRGQRLSLEQNLPAPDAFSGIAAFVVGRFLSDILGLLVGEQRGLLPCRCGQAALCSAGLVGAS